MVRTCRPRPRGKQVDAVELRVVAAAVLAVAADAVLIAQRLLKLFAHLVNNLARKRSLEAGRTREKKGGEERRNVRNYVWQFGTGNTKCKWRAREYPEREK
jgi:hypothetical protein